VHAWTRRAPCARLGQSRFAAIGGESDLEPVAISTQSGWPPLSMST